MALARPPMAPNRFFLTGDLEAGAGAAEAGTEVEASGAASSSEVIGAAFGADAAAAGTSTGAEAGFAAVSVDERVVEMVFGEER